MLHPTHAILQSQNGSARHRRTFVIALVASLHVVLFWALLSAMAPTFVQTFAELSVVPIDEKKIEKVEAAPPPKQIVPSVDKVAAIPPVIVIAPEPGAGPVTIDRPETTKTPGSGIADTGPLAANARTIPPYPALAARLGVEGRVTIRLTISESGLVTAADLVTSSDSGELDRAAISWVMANWRYKPATHSGQPIASSTEVTMNFTLTGRR